MGLRMDVAQPGVTRATAFGLRWPQLHEVAILALVLATVSRLLETYLGFPRATNWVHFPIIAGLALLSLRQVERAAAPLFLGCGALLAVFLISAAVNGAGLINAVLGFLLLGEPFLLLAILVNSRPTRASVHAMGWWLLSLSLVQIPVAFMQWPRAQRAFNADLVQGTFEGMGPGHHVMGALALTGGLYLLHSFRTVRWWIAWPLAGLLFCLVVMSDSKQIILAFFVAYALLRARSVRSPAAAVWLNVRLLLGVAAIWVVLWYAGKAQYFEHIPLVLYGFANKLAVLPLLARHTESAAQWIFGLGPGHGVSRLGGWLIETYWPLLEGLGGTRTEIAAEAWRVTGPYEHVSSVFALLFSWAGILGDVGLAGLGVYAALVWYTYRRLCVDDLARLILISVAILGFLFEWLEEPNFMLFVFAVIAQKWLARASAASAPDAG